MGIVLYDSIQHKAGQSPRVHEAHNLSLAPPLFLFLYVSSSVFSVIVVGITVETMKTGVFTKQWDVRSNILCFVKRQAKLNC